MRTRWDSRLGTALLALAAGVVAGRTAGVLWRTGLGIAKARAAIPYRRAGTGLRILVVGDGSGAGAGARHYDESVPGRLAVELTNAAFYNFAEPGTRIHHVPEQLRRAGARRFDVVLIFAGANDIPALTSVRRYRAGFERALRAARSRARLVIAFGPPDFSRSRLLPWPVSQFARARAAGYRRAMSETAASQDAEVVELPSMAPRRRGEDFFAVDGWHPSSTGYQAWYDALLSQTSFRTLIAPPAVEKD